MAKRARRFQDYGAAELLTSEPDSREHKRIGRGMCMPSTALSETSFGKTPSNAGAFAKLTQNPAMKQHLLNTGTKRLAEASLFDPLWGIGLRADDPRGSRPPCRWRGIKLLGENISAARDTNRTSEAELAHPSSLIKSALRYLPTEFVRLLRRP